MDVNASSLLLARLDSISVPAGKTKSSKRKQISFEMNRESATGKVIRKTKSLGTQFLVNMDELINSVASTGGYDETVDCIHSTRSSSNDVGFISSTKSSLEPADDTFPGGKIGEEMDQPFTVDDDQASCAWRRMHLEPTLPIWLKFEDLKYKVLTKGEKHKDREKFILQGITGSVEPGEVLALMGPSGGGKTTLLNLLSGRVKNRCGSITYNDHPYDKSLRPRIGYVLQDDVVLPHLTVKEALTYAALLRLPNTFTRRQKKERAMSIIAELSLETCQDTVIGGPSIRGISGGERKRVCIGNEILLNPSLLFLDEPTSGLDSTTALRIVQMLHNLAQAGKTVVATIHQPSSRLFAKFDKLILLGKGSSLYSGKASEAMPYFSSIGCSPYIAMNPAEFLIDLANGNMNDKSIPSKLEDKFFPASRIDPSPGEVHEYLVGAYEESSESKGMLRTPAVVNGVSQEFWSTSTDKGATWFEQFSVLLQRGFKERRHEYLSTIRVVQVVSTALIVGLLWWRSDSSSPNKVKEQAGLLFFISVFWAFLPLFTAIFTFPVERAVLVKERSVGMYELTAYFMAKNTSDIPLDLILPVVFQAIVYFMVGLERSFNAFFLTLFTISLNVVAAQGLGQAIGAAFLDIRKATTLASITVMTFMLAGGFFIRKVPSFMSWVRYVSFNYHTYRLLLKIQFNCSQTSSGLNSGNYAFINCGSLGWGGVEVGAMFMMIIGYRVLAYLFLRRLNLRTIS